MTQSEMAASKAIWQAAREALAELETWRDDNPQHRPQVKLNYCLELIKQRRASSI